MVNPSTKQASQRDRFIEAARAAGADEDMDAFRAKLGVIARQKPAAAMSEPTFDKEKS